MFLAVDIIKKKRAGKELSKDEINYFIQGFVDNKIPDYQMSALLMSIYFQGLSQQETGYLTQSMLKSGTEMNWQNFVTFKVDKHSTGGVGDKTSLIIGPIVAALGYAVPMISGRGLGHTGGTLDKLESLKGFNTQLNLVQFAEIVKTYRLCFIGQTKEICPADKKIYALRDVTGTVESRPLICASIVSKKLAEGIDGLVLDVKFGSGAFMKSKQDAEALALDLKHLAESSGKKVVAVLSNMNQPLGRYAGNRLEVEECLQILSHQIPKNYENLYQETIDLSLHLSAHMLTLANKKDFSENLELAKEALASGAAFKVFQNVVQAQGGSLEPISICQKNLTVIAPHEGYIESFDTESIGMACILLRAGRQKSDDILDLNSGIEFHKKIGDPVSKGENIFTLFAHNEVDLKMAQERLQRAFKISLQKPPIEDLIYRVFA